MLFRSGSALLGQSVFFRDVRLGEVEDVLLDVDLARVLGFVVLCGDGAHRMLPLTAADLGDDRIAVSSALVLMEDAFYRKRCRTLDGVVGATLRLAGREAGRVADLRFDGEGRVRRIVVETPGGQEEIEPDGSVALDGGAAASAV